MTTKQNDDHRSPHDASPDASSEESSRDATADDIGESMTGARTPPRPLRGSLAVAFFSVLFLIFITQGLAIFNSGTLSRTLASYAEGEVAIRNLGMALLELQDAVHTENAWLTAGDSAAFDPFRYAARIRAAEEDLKSVSDLPEEYAKVREAVGAAFEDVKTRHILIQEAMSENRLAAAQTISADRRALDESFHVLGAALGESRRHAQDLQAEALRESAHLDRSLTIIIVSMLVAAALLAYLWKRLVELH